MSNLYPQLRNNFLKRNRKFQEFLHFLHPPPRPLPPPNTVDAFFTLAGDWK
jgi:hypothetical protein